MSNVSHHEQLLTALFDGELTGEERRQAERLLADNPEYQRLFRSWQDQADELRALPAYQLDDGFAERVLQTIRAKSDSVDHAVVVPSRGESQWRVGLAVITTLAAMLLLTLFVFPKVSGLVSITKMASLDEKADEAAAISNAVPNGGDSKRGGGVDRGEMKGFRFKGGGSGERQTASIADEASKKSDLAQEVDPSYLEKGAPLAAPPSRPAVPKFSKNAPALQTANAPSPLDDSIVMGKEGRSVDGKMGNAPRLQGQELKTAGGNQSYRLEVPPSQKAGNAVGDRSFEQKPLPRYRQERASRNREPSTADQVLLVEMEPRSEPLQRVTLVLARNHIRVLSSEGAKQGLANDEASDFEPEKSRDKSKGEEKTAPEHGRGGGLGGGMDLAGVPQNSPIVPQSPAGVEALYVIATNSQMRQAMIELSDHANVYGYQIPANAPVPETPSLSANEANDASLGAAAQHLQAHTLNIRLDDGRRTKGAAASQVPRSPGDAEFGPAQSPSGKGGRTEIAELDRWFHLPETAKQERLNRYLLLVRILSGKEDSRQGVFESAPPSQPAADAPPRPSKNPR